MNGEPPNARETREAQLYAAAEALVVWVRARRATWSGAPDEIAVAPEAPEAHVFPPEALEAHVLPPVPQPLPSRPSSGPVVLDVLAVAREWAPPPVQPVVIPAVRVRVATRRVSLGMVGRLALGAVLVAALVAMAIGGRWLAREYEFKPAAPKTGTAVLESVPPGSQVIVDGNVAGTTPLTTQLTAGHHIVGFRRRGATRLLDVEVVAGRSTTGRVDWNAKRTGSLVVVSEPAGAQVLIDDAARGVTPLTLDNLTLGAHSVEIQSDNGSVRRTVEVTADGTAQVAESIYAGWLKVFAPFEIEIADGGRGIHLDERGQAMLTPGSHDVRFENAEFGYSETRRVEIKPGEVSTISLAPPPSTLTVTANVPAEVLVDGESAGRTPLTDHPLPLGTHNILVRSATGVRRFGTTVTVKPVRIDVDFSKP